MRKTDSVFKRVISAALLLILVVSLFSGCHGAADRNEFVIPEEFDTSRHYEITFWAKNDTNMSQVEVYKQAIANFQECYPNITVNLKLYTDYGRLYEDVITNIPTDTTPNVCITYPDHIATYLTGNNCVVPLDELMADPKYGLGGSALRFDGPTQDQVVEKFLNEGKIDGISYALPFMRSTEACYINKTYVEKLGYTLPEVLTWDFLWEVSDAAMKKNEDGTFAVNGQKILIPFVYKSTDNMMIQMLQQLGAGYAKSDGTIEIFNDTTRSVLFEVAEHVEKKSFSTFKIESYPADLLNAGRCIFAVDSTAGATWMGPDAPLLDISADQIVDFELAVRPVPQMDPENPQMISQGPSVCIFNKADTQEVLASWLFAQFLLTDSVQVGYSQTEGYLPVTTKAQQSEEYLDYVNRSGEDNELHYWVKVEVINILQKHTDNTFVTPVFNGSASLRDAAGQMIEKVTRSVRRKETVDDGYIDQLYKDVTVAHKLDQLGGAQLSRPDLGPLPEMSVWLLAVLGGVWVLLGTLAVVRKIKRK